jgi:hypothetical protein
LRQSIETLTHKCRIATECGQLPLALDAAPKVLLNADRLPRVELAIEVSS